MPQKARQLDRDCSWSEEKRRQWVDRGVSPERRRRQTVQLQGLLWCLLGEDHESLPVASPPAVWSRPQGTGLSPLTWRAHPEAIGNPGSFHRGSYPLVDDLRNIVVDIAAIGVRPVVKFDHLLAFFLGMGFQRSERGRHDLDSGRTHQIKS
jgi:hypothetical protein